MWVQACVPSLQTSDLVLEKEAFRQMTDKLEGSLLLLWSDKQEEE